MQWRRNPCLLTSHLSFDQKPQSSNEYEVVWEIKRPILMELTFCSPSKERVDAHCLSFSSSSPSSSFLSTSWYHTGGALEDYWVISF